MISTLYLAPKCLALPSLWHGCNDQQNLFLPWWRTCADAHKTGWHTFVSSGWGAGNKEAELLRMPGGREWGIPVTAQAPVTELMTRHRHFSKGKFIKSWTGEAWKEGSDQRAGDHAMCHLPCSLLFSRILCYYSGLYVCYSIPNMKFTIFAILSTQLSGIKYIHIAVQPSPPSIFTNLLSPQH